MEVMTKDLKVMDATAIAFCRDNKIPIVVFDMSPPGLAARRSSRAAAVGTVIHASHDRMHVDPRRRWVRWAA